MNTNIDFWERVVKNPTEPYRVLFEKENEYLHKQIKPNSSLLDIGCGDGRTILSLLDITTNIKAIDNDPKALSDAKNNLKAYPSVSLQLADAQHIPFDNKTFDYAVLMMTLVNFADNKEKILTEMKRVLKDDGKIIISVYADTAIEERLTMYKQIEVPIKEIKKGCVIFDESVGAHISEQFSKKEVEDLVSKVGLNIANYKEVGKLAYIYTLNKS